MSTSLPARTCNCQALILNSRNHRDADRILTLLTPELGKLDALARGVRRTSSRKAGHLEPFMLVEMNLARTRWLPVVREVQPRKVFPGCRTSLERIGLASYACELVNALVQPNDDAEVNLAAYHNLALTLGELSDELDAAPGLMRWFELSMLRVTGFQPELFHCVHCGAEAQPAPTAFNIPDGGILCAQCGQEHAGSLMLPLDAFKIMRHMTRYDWPAVKRATMKPQALETIRKVLAAYTTHILERPLKSVRFVQRVPRAQ